MDTNLYSGLVLRGNCAEGNYTHTNCTRGDAQLTLIEQMIVIKKFNLTSLEGNITSKIL